MQTLFSLDSPLVKWLNTLTDLFVLNVLWLVCCIPVVTIGASTSAMYNITIKMVRSEDTGIVKPFFAAFKKDFKQATIRFLIILTAALILFGDYEIIRSSSGGTALYVVLAFGVIIWSFTEAYVFPLTSYFDNTHMNTFKNAVILSIINFPRTLIIVILKVSPVLLALFSPELFYRTSFVWVTFGWALLAYISSYIFKVIFEKIA